MQTIQEIIEKHKKYEEEREKMIWPTIAKGLIPSGFLKKEESGERGAFRTVAPKKTHKIDFCLPTKYTTDENIAREVLEEAIDFYKGWKPGEGDGCLTIQTEEGEWKVNFQYAFHFVLIEKV